MKVASIADKPSTLAARLAQLIYQWRRRAATVIAIAIAALLGYHVVFGANGITVYQQKRQEDRALQKQILELQQENGHLSDHVQHLRTDPDAIEHEARMILRYAKPGEVIYELNEKTSSGPPAK
ncbi:MAG TPA: septum formation initiator family protein [Acidobacteriaceae bacterium]